MRMAEFTIEKTKLKDTRELSRLECRCYGYAWHPYANWAWKTISGYGYAFTARSKAGGRIIGGIAAVAGARKRSLYLDSVVVSNSWRGRGVGKRLVGRIVAIARRDSLRLEAHVDAGNAAMIGLLEGAGFARVRHACNYYDESPKRAYLLYRKRGN